MKKQERDYYNSLYEIASELNSAKDSNYVLRAIVETVSDVFSAKGCSFLLLSPDKEKLLHTANYGLSEEFIRKGPVSPTTRIAAAVLEGKPTAVEDVATDKRIEYLDCALSEGIVSFLSVPVKLRGEVIGILRIYTGDKRHFSKADKDFAGLVANLGAIAFERSKLYEALRKDYEALRSYYFPFL